MAKDSKKGKNERTHAEVFTFTNAAQRWLVDHAKELKAGETKFSYALRKVLKACSRIVEAYQEKIEELNIDHCETDDNDVIIKSGPKEDNGYVFTKDGRRKRDAARKKLFETSVAVEPHVVQDVPDDLTYEQREAFAGFILPEMPEEEVAGPKPVEERAG